MKLLRPLPWRGNLWLGFGERAQRGRFNSSLPRPSSASIGYAYHLLRMSFLKNKFIDM